MASQPKNDVQQAATAVSADAPPLAPCDVGKGKIMRWNFETSEVSAGHYHCKGVRENGQSIERDGGESVVLETLYVAFESEVALGTHAGEAIFHITHGFLPNWDGVYYKEIFGSWTVSKSGTNKRIDYDGRDAYLTITSTGEGFAWQGQLKS